MKPLLQLAFLLLPSLCFGEGKELIHPGNPEIRVNLGAADVIKDLGEGELKIWIIQKGTRSEGLHGHFEGRDDPSEKVISIQTPSGKLVYRGDWEDRPFPWAASGWLPEDLDAPLIKEERIEYPFSPVELAGAIEDTLEYITHSEDQQIQHDSEDYSLTYSCSLNEGAIVFTLIEHKGITSSTYTKYTVSYPERRSKPPWPKDRSQLIVSSYTSSEGTKIEELELLSYRLKQIKEGISSR